MHAQIRVAQLAAARSATWVPRRLLATPTTSATGTPLTAGVTGGATATPTPLQYSVATPVGPTPGSQFPPPPPPPPPPRRPRRLFRRFLGYTTLGLLVFYPTSGLISLKSEAYRDFFTSNFPGGEFVASFIEDRGWETSSSSIGARAQATKAQAEARLRDLERSISGAGKKAEAETKAFARDVQSRVSEASSSAKSAATPGPVTLPERAAYATREAVDSVKAKAEQVKEAVKPRPVQVTLPERAAAAAHDASDAIKSRAQQAKQAATVTLPERASAAAHEVVDAAKHKTAQAEDAVKPTVIALPERAAAAAQEVSDKAKSIAADARSRVNQATTAASHRASGLVNEAERLVGKGEQKAEDLINKGEQNAEKAVAKGEKAVHDVKEKIDATPGPRGYLDAQRPRELRPETVVPQKPSNEGKTIFASDLPLGFEPPPGTYIPPPPVSRTSDGDKPTLPLLAPKVKEFAASEPIISQLASTIDSLTSSLSTPTTGDAKGILTKAHDDLSALSQHLENVKKEERANLEKAITAKTREFEALLNAKSQERVKGEQGLKEGWEKERSRLVEDWRHTTETELEQQRQGIEQRLHDEVISQGIELQRRWLRSIKTQVETERGGRLAKLDHLTTSLKQLEKITLDNSSTLDDNVRLHKVWSALRAVQAKAERGDIAFDDELRILRALSTSNEQSNPDSVAATTLTQLERSGIAQTGVKSFAQLASWFSNSVSPKVHSASLVPAPENASVVSHLSSAVVSKIMFTPKAGLVEGDDVNSVLARAEWCLGEKDLDGAAREINSLRGWPGKLAADWLREARRRLEVQQALEIVGTEATLGSLLLV